MRFGTITLLGRPNVGKSTFLNAALGENLAIVSPVPQTTRDALLGVVHRPDAQLAFIDTPGVHRPRSELGRRMNSAALDALHTADVVVFMTDTLGLPDRVKRTRAAKARSQPSASVSDGPTVIHPGDVELLKLLPDTARCVLAINKVDRLRDKGQLLLLSEEFCKLREFESVVPICSRAMRDVELLLNVLEPLTPEGPQEFAEDDLTNQPTLFFAREYVREQVLLQTGREVPHASAVTIDTFDVGQGITTVAATIHVEKVGQRKILVGRGGTVIREIGRGARLRLQELLGNRVHLELFVRVTPRWRNAPRQLAEMGYETGRTDSASKIEDAPRRRKRPSNQKKRS